jgi:hypothetical protein
VRPPLKPEDPGYDLIPQRFRNSTVQITSPSSFAVDASNGRKVFVFDRVFGEEIDQEGVFEYVNESVNSFVQGYNVSILAYGQSGAGKSYTMGTTGPQDQENAQIMGIIPRSADVLFEKLEGPNKAAGSGIRAPSRLSGLAGAQTNNAKSSSNKNWQLNATYVEVSYQILFLPPLLIQTDLQRISSRSSRPRTHPSERALDGSHSRRYQGPHHSHRPYPDQHQLSRRPSQCSQLWVFHPSDRCHGRQCQVFALARCVQSEPCPEEELVDAFVEA